MAKKFIINKDRVVMSASVDFHRELSSNHSTTKGGGYWYALDSVKKLFFYDKSEEFGVYTQEDLKECFDDSLFSPKFQDYELISLPGHSLLKTMKEGVLIGKISGY